jgi:phosphomannomutase/phosphomannomutase/phosphoglucomutase
VHDIGLCGTEVVYYATFAHEMDGGIMVTASHNPPDYNGMKFVREGSRPISGDTGLKDIREIAEAGEFTRATRTGDRFAMDAMPGYIEHLLRYVDRTKLKPLKIVVHAGNGGAD